MNNAEIVKAIFQMDIDGAKVIAGLQQTAGAYRDISAEATKQSAIVQDLTAQEVKLTNARNASNSPMAVIAYNKQIELTKQKIQAANAELSKATIATKQAANVANELQTNLGKAFDVSTIKGAQAELDKIKSTLGSIPQDPDKIIPVESLRTQLRNLREQIAVTTDPAELARLSVEAGHVKERFNEANEAIKQFSGGSKFENLGTGLGNVATRLLSLDFKGAAQGAKLLNAEGSKITFKDTLVAIKQIGSTLLDLGRALLTNPLFLIGAAIVAIYEGFSYWNENAKMLDETLNKNAETIRKINDPRRLCRCAWW